MTGIVLGNASVVIGEGQGGEHSVEQLADMMLAKLISVSGDIPQPAKDQLFAFRDRARQLFIVYLTEAKAAERRLMLKAP